MEVRSSVPVPARRARGNQLRERWRLPAAALAVGVAGALAIVASSHAAITITSLEARARGASITSGPMGSGYDIRIVANVSGRDDWRIDQLDDRRRDPVRQPRRPVRRPTAQSNRRPRVPVRGQRRRSKLLRPAPGDLPDPDKVGPSEHVFTPPVGGTSQLRIDLFRNDNCSGTRARDQRSHPHDQRSRHKQAAHRSVSGAEGRRRSGRVGIDRERRTTGQERDESLAQGLVDTGARMAVFKFSTTADTSFITPYQHDHSGVDRRQQPR